VAVLKRLRSCGDWLGHLIVQWLSERGLTTQVPPLQVRVVDGSVVTMTGQEAQDYRMHMRFDLARMRMADVELTPTDEGESLSRHIQGNGEVLLADRGYGKPPQMGTALLTSLTTKEISAAHVLELYRLRRQIELAFKRIKSLLHLNLRNKSEDMARTYLLANILGALLIDELCGKALSFFPGDFGSSLRPVSHWILYDIWTRALKSAIKGTVTMKTLIADIPNLARHLGDTPRKRKRACYSPIRAHPT